MVSSSHQSNKRTTIENNVSEDGNLQLHEKIIHTIIVETQSMQNSGPGIISKLVEDSKNNPTSEEGTILENLTSLYGMK